MAENIDAERAAFETWARDTDQGYASLKGTCEPGAWYYFEDDAQAAWAAWQAGRRTPSASIGEDGLPELAALRAEVREWLCEGCRTVYPGPPAPGFSCVICPTCKGLTGPRGLMERRALERQVVDLRVQLARQSKGEQICTLRVEKGYYQIFGERDKIIGVLPIGEYPLYVAPPLSSEQQAEKGDGTCGS